MSILFRKKSKNVTENEDVEKLIQNWNPPKVPIHHIYKRKGFFESSKNYEIKTTEKRRIIQGEYTDLQLLDKSLIPIYKQNYDSLHMGFVQVAVKPLTINGMNYSILAAIRDCRNLNFESSRLAIAEFCLNNGPVYFNCYPSYQVSLRDPHILETLTLNLKVNGYNSELDESSRDIEVIYKVYYKLISNNVDPKERKSLVGIEVISKVYYKLISNNVDPKERKSLVGDYTNFIATNVASDNVAVEGTTAWDSVEVPERWSVRIQP